ncbi:MAG: uroporphyrinogen decarboxylase family protein [Verrucomicrobiae bacterium]|nr:uroporphyrinogen decarboxylase family protein [Verrucomicrobiae bacterium]
MFEKIFSSDRMTKRERVEATLNHQPVDRAAILEQVSFNPRVITDWTGKTIKDFNYTLDDICEVIRKTLDLTMPPCPPRGTERIIHPDGFVDQNDNWTAWHVSRPFSDAEGARDWILRCTRETRENSFDPAKEREEYRRETLGLQSKIGDTVILRYFGTGLCGVYDRMGLEIFTFFQLDYPDVLLDYLESTIKRQLALFHAIADPSLSPTVMIAEDFATKHGPIFSADFLRKFHFPYVKKAVDAWHEHGVKVLYHSDGNWKMSIPDVQACGVDGFYCLEKNCGMDVVELKNSHPELVWAGGVDGVDLMERGTPEQIREEVHRHIRETNALSTGGMFVASSSEINPTIPPENFRTMIHAVGELRNPFPD